MTERIEKRTALKRMGQSGRGCPSGGFSGLRCGFIHYRSSDPGYRRDRSAYAIELYTGKYKTIFKEEPAMKAQAMINEEEPITMNVIMEGKGELFTDPDPDHARAFFQKKSRKMVNKSMTLAKAIETFVHDGDYLAMGGFGGNRSPIAACHEILRQGRKHMGLAGHTTTHEFEF